MKKYIIILLILLTTSIYAQEPFKDSATGKFYFARETETGMERINKLLYDEVSTFYTKYALAKLDGKWYVLDQKLKHVRGPFDYADRESFDNNGEAAVKVNGTWNVLSYKNKLMFKRSVPDSVFFYSPDDLSYFQKSGEKIYYAQIRQRKWLDISCKKNTTPGEEGYEDCGFDGYLTFGAYNLTAVKKEKYGFVNNKFNIIVPFIYDYASLFNNSNTALVKKENLYGYLDSSLNLFIPFIFNNAQPFMGSVAAVQKGDWYGLINKQIKTVAPFEYQSLICIDENGVLYSAKKGNRYGLIDSSNHIVFPFEYDADFVYINSNCFIARKNALYGLINIVQRTMVPFEYYSYDAALKNKNLIIFHAMQNSPNPYYIYNTFGDKRNDQGYQAISYFISDRCRVKRNEKYGFIDASGYEVIPCEYDEVSLFFNGKSEVKKGGKKFYINETGQKVQK